MAIQRISDLPIYKYNDKDRDKLKDSFMEMSLQVSSDQVNNVSKYESKALKIGSLIEIIDSVGKGDKYVFPETCYFLSGMEISGNIDINNKYSGVYDLNTDFRRSKQKYSALTVDVDSWNIKLDGEDFIIYDNDTVNVKNKFVNFQKLPTVPTASEDSSQYSVVNIQYLNSVIGGQGAQNQFEIKYFDYYNNDLKALGWLKCNDGGWYEADKYANTYQHLASDINGKSVNTETITVGTTKFEVKYYLADDGHKICKKDNETQVDALYEKTGMAWYYIIDETNKKFKLPRNKWFFQNNSNSSGYQNVQGLPQPNITATVQTFGVRHSTTPCGENNSNGPIMKVCSRHEDQDTISIGGNITINDGDIYNKNNKNLQPNSVNLFLCIKCN